MNQRELASEVFVSPKAALHTPRSSRRQLRHWIHQRRAWNDAHVLTSLALDDHDKDDHDNDYEEKARRKELLHHAKRRTLLDQLEQGRLADKRRRQQVAQPTEKKRRFKKIIHRKIIKTVLRKPVLVDEDEVVEEEIIEDDEEEFTEVDYVEDEEEVTEQDVEEEEEVLVDDDEDVVEEFEDSKGNVFEIMDENEIEEEEIIFYEDQEDEIPFDNQGDEEEFFAKVRAENEQHEQVSLTESERIRQEEEEFEREQEELFRLAMERQAEEEEDLEWEEEELRREQEDEARRRAEEEQEAAANALSPEEAAKMERRITLTGMLQSRPAEKPKKKAPKEESVLDKEIGYRSPEVIAMINQAKMETRPPPPPEHKQEYVPIVADAASIGRLVRLNENIIEAQGKRDIKEFNTTSTDSSYAEWELNHSQRGNQRMPVIKKTRSTTQIMIHEAAALGRMKNIRKMDPTGGGISLQGEEIDIDDMGDAKHDGAKVFRTEHLIDRHVELHRKQKTDWTPDYDTQEYRTLDDVQLPTPQQPSFKPIQTQKTPQELREALSQSVAEGFWNRHYRLERPGAPLKVTSGCFCKYCNTASVWQTYAYQKKWADQRLPPGEKVDKDADPETFGYIARLYVSQDTPDDIEFVDLNEQDESKKDVDLASVDGSCSVDFSFGSLDIIDESDDEESYGDEEHMASLQPVEAPVTVNPDTTGVVEQKEYFDEREARSIPNQKSEHGGESDDGTTMNSVPVSVEEAEREMAAEEKVERAAKPVEHHREALPGNNESSLVATDTPGLLQESQAAAGDTPTASSFAASGELRVNSKGLSHEPEKKLENQGSAASSKQSQQAVAMTRDAPPESTPVSRSVEAKPLRTSTHSRSSLGADGRSKPRRFRPLKWLKKGFGQDPNVKARQARMSQKLESLPDANSDFPHPNLEASSSGLSKHVQSNGQHDHGNEVSPLVRLDTESAGDMLHREDEMPLSLSAEPASDTILPEVADEDEKQEVDTEHSDMIVGSDGEVESHPEILNIQEPLSLVDRGINKVQSTIKSRLSKLSTLKAQKSARLEGEKSEKNAEYTTSKEVPMERDEPGADLPVEVETVNSTPGDMDNGDATEENIAARLMEATANDTDVVTVTTHDSPQEDSSAEAVGAMNIDQDADDSAPQDEGDKADYAGEAIASPGPASVALTRSTGGAVRRESTALEARLEAYKANATMNGPSSSLPRPEPGKLVHPKLDSGEQALAEAKQSASTTGRPGNEIKKLDTAKNVVPGLAEEISTVTPTTTPIKENPSWIRTFTEKTSSVQKQEVTGPSEETTPVLCSNNDGQAVFLNGVIEQKSTMTSTDVKLIENIDSIAPAPTPVKEDPSLIPRAVEESDGMQRTLDTFTEGERSDILVKSSPTRVSRSFGAVPQEEITEVKKLDPSKIVIAARENDASTIIPTPTPIREDPSWIRMSSPEQSPDLPTAAAKPLEEAKQVDIQRRNSDAAKLEDTTVKRQLSMLVKLRTQKEAMERAALAAGKNETSNEAWIPSEIDVSTRAAEADIADVDRSELIQRNYSDHGGSTGAIMGVTGDEPSKQAVPNPSSVDGGDDDSLSKKSGEPAEEDHRPVPSPDAEKISIEGHGASGAVSNDLTSTFAENRQEFTGSSGASPHAKPIGRVSSSSINERPGVRKSTMVLSTRELFERNSTHDVAGARTSERPVLRKSTMVLSTRALFEKNAGPNAEGIPPWGRLDFHREKRKSATLSSMNHEIQRDEGSAVVRRNETEEVALGGRVSAFFMKGT